LAKPDRLSVPLLRCKNLSGLVSGFIEFSFLSDFGVQSFSFGTVPKAKALDSRTKFIALSLKEKLNQSRKSIYVF